MSAVACTAPTPWHEPMTIGWFSSATRFAARLFAALVAAMEASDPPAALAATARAAGVLEDRLLVERAAQGDRRAFDDLYRRWSDFVWHRLGRLLGPDPEREDLLQQVFLDTYRALPRFRGDAAFSTWLHRIVVNVAYDHLRRRKRRPTNPLELEEIAALASPAMSPEATARRREELLRIASYLDRLKPKKRIAFVLRVVDELALEEIGGLVGASAATVGQRVYHAERELAAMAARDELAQSRRARA